MQLPPVSTSVHADLEQLLTRSFPGEGELIGVELDRATERRSGRCLVVVQGTHLVGAALYRPVRQGSVFVVYLAVAPEWRRRGFASRLLDEVTTLEHAAHLEVLVRSDNHVAQRFYRRGGLQPGSRPAQRSEQLWSWSGRWHGLTASK